MPLTVLNADTAMRTSLTTKYDYVPVGTVWPSGDFSVGSRRVDWHGGGEPDLRSEVRRIDDGDYVLPDGWTYHGNGRTTFDPSAKPAPTEHFLWPDLACGASGGVSPLNLTDVPNSHSVANRPEKYGKLGMTGYGKKMVRSACALLERRFKGRLTFATVTMPTLSPEQRRQLAECWPEFVRQALQWLTRRLRQKRLPPAICSVTEIQPKRLQAGNGGYLHLHMVWPNLRMKEGWYSVDPREFRAWCESFLLRRGLWCEGAWVNVNTQKVEKSAAAYLSKYMSKGGDTLAQFADENGWLAVPGQWWNLTKPMRDAVKAEVVKGQAVGEWLNAMVDYALQFCDGSAFWSVRTVDMEYDGRLITVGYCGILKAEHVRDVVDMVRSA